MAGRKRHETLKTKAKEDEKLSREILFIFFFWFGISYWHLKMTNTCVEIIVFWHLEMHMWWRLTYSLLHLLLRCACLAKIKLKWEELLNYVKFSDIPDDRRWL